MFVVFVQINYAFDIIIREGGKRRETVINTHRTHQLTCTSKKANLGSYVTKEVGMLHLMDEVTSKDKTIILCILCTTMHLYKQ